MKKYLMVLYALAGIWTGLSAQRIEQSINTSWQFHKGDIELNQTDQPVGGPVGADAVWQGVSLPHSWNKEDVTDDKPGYYQGIGVYKKTIYVPDAYKNKEVYLYFEGAAQVADVYLNKHFIGRHTGSYTAFSFRITDGLLFDGHQNKNEIEVKVDNSHSENIPPLSADFTFYGGIYRDVYLLALDKIHFDADNYASSGVFISTPTVDSQRASVLIKGKVSSRELKAEGIALETTIYDQKGNSIDQATQDLVLEPGSNTSFQVNISDIRHPNLWSPDHPYLYQVVSRIVDKKTGTIIDEVNNPLGFRWFKFTADNGFFINGKHVKLWGTSRHQDYPHMANALPDALQIKDIALLKAMGANLLRIAHYPQDPSLLQACDRLGIITSVEIPIVNAITENDTFRTNSLNMMTEMIHQNYNHPSVMIWAFMNEVLLRLRFADNKPRQQVYIGHVKELAKSLDSLSRLEDSTRYTMIPFHGDLSLYIRSGLTEIPQIIGWNQYSGWYGKDIHDFEKNMDRHHRELADKPMLVTEFGADGDSRLHSFTPLRFDKSLEYETYFHQVYQDVINRKPFISGAMIWNLADFNAEARKESMPHINNKGLLTGERKPKAAYLYYQACLLQKPFIAIGSRSWDLRSAVADFSSSVTRKSTTSNTATASDRCTQMVDVYTNQTGPVSLTLNGRLIGEKQSKDHVARFLVPFENGANHLEVLARVRGRSRDTTIKDDAVIEFKLIPNNLKDTLLPFSSINVSLGDQRFYTDAEGAPWLPEQSYQPGGWGYIGGSVFKLKNTSRQPYGSDKDILGTDDDPVYETQREGIEGFKLDVPKGRYSVTLHFAELLSAALQDPNIYNLDTAMNNSRPADMAERQFNVLINGQTVIQGLSNKTYLIPETAYSTKVFVDVTGNDGIMINFKPVKGKTILNGLQILKIF